MNFDILCINETRLDKAINNSEIGLQGYDLTRLDRNRNGGGVAIYVRNNISYMERSALVPENVEALCIEVSRMLSQYLFRRGTDHQIPTLRFSIFLKFFSKALIKRTKKL